MADGYVSSSAFSQELTNFGTAVATRSLRNGQKMTWDGTNLTWGNTVITSWPTNIPDTQIVELYGFTDASQIPSWVPRGKPNIVFQASTGLTASVLGVLPKPTSAPTSTQMLVLNADGTTGTQAIPTGPSSNASSLTLADVAFPTS